MNVHWHEDAEQDLDNALTYYGGIDEELDEHLSERFAAAIEIAIAEIKSRPTQPRKFDGEARKIRLKRFKYAVIYWIDTGAIRILAIMHQHREPGYWHGGMPY